MLQVSWYLLKVVLCSGILMGYYWLMLRNKIYHHYNRFFLLASVVLSLTLPLLHINIWHYADEPKSQAIELLQAVTSSDDYVNELHTNGSNDYFTASQVMQVLYILVCLIFFMLFIRVLWIIRNLIYKYKGQIVERFYFVNTDARGTPFSFLNYIFWNEAIDLDSKTGQQIFRHEVAHVQEKHSYDKLFMNLVLIMCWCNPFFWLMRKELHMIHEFIADQKAVGDSDTSSFAAMILQAAYPKHRFELTNNFFYSPIKRRLLMLTKNQNPSVSYISRIMVLPLAVLVFAAFTLKSKTVTPPAKADAGHTFTVMLDAGHGGDDMGATAATGQIEKELTLALVQKIKALHSGNTFRLVLTRDEDRGLTPKERVNAAKQEKADLFISIHLDNQPGASAEHSGMQVYIARETFNNAASSRLLASAIINASKDNYGLPVAANPAQRQAGIWVLQANDCPAVLIEAGYLSNDKDLRYLQSAGGQEALARNVLAAVENYCRQPQHDIPAGNQPAAVNDIPQDTIPQINVQGQNNRVTITNIRNAKADKKPLVIVDGKITSDMNSIEPENIATMDVLKNDAGVKIYGQSAKNGVVIITSKAAVAKKQAASRGKAGDIPLYALNGKILTPEEVKNVDAEDIAEINILKGDRARLLYGDIAANGIVELKTKTAAVLNEVVAVGYAQKSEAAGSGPVIDNAAENVVTERIQRGGEILVFTHVEKKAQFPGGKAAWQKYLEKNINPNIALDEGWKAGVYKVMIQFIVDKDGAISDVKALNYTKTKTAQHCIDLIKNGPKWNPAVQNGHKVKAYTNQPITFVIQE